VPGRDPAAVGADVHPVPFGRSAAETDLVVAGGVDVDLPVVQHSGVVGGVGTLGGARLHGERGVDGTGEVAPHDVLAAGRDRCLVVHGVGVVPGEAAGRRDDAVEHRPVRIELLVGVQAALEDVGQVAEPLGDVVVAHRRSGHHPFVGRSAQDRQQVVEGGS
jgi:hypothetical protein